MRKGCGWIVGDERRSEKTRREESGGGRSGRRSGKAQPSDMIRSLGPSGMIDSIVIIYFIIILIILVLRMTTYHYYMTIYNIMMLILPSHAFEIAGRYLLMFGLISWVEGLRMNPSLASSKARDKSKSSEKP